MGLTVGKSPPSRATTTQRAPPSRSRPRLAHVLAGARILAPARLGPAGIKTVALGVNPAQVAALKAGNVQGIVTSSSIGYIAGEVGRWPRAGRVRRPREGLPHPRDLRQQRLHHAQSDRLRRFLAGWIETVAFMATHRDETIKLVAPVSQLSDDIQAREYDKAMPMMSRDLRFLPKAIETLSRSFVELEILPAAPDMKTLYTEEFLPPKS